MAPAISFDDTSVAFSYKSDSALKKANFIFSMVNHPWLSAMATSSVKLALKLNLPVEGIIRKTAFEHFCGGETIENSAAVIDQLASFNIGTILDYSVEGEKSENGFDKTMQETLRTVTTASQSGRIPFTVFKVTGLASFDLLEKIQAKKELTKAEEAAFQRVRFRVNKICLAAHREGIPVLIDAEETWIQDTIDLLAYEMMSSYNKEKAIVFNTYQLYRTQSLSNLKEAVAKGKQQGYFLGAKVVRGAYMEKERERASQLGYPSPIQPDKEASDNAFNDALKFCVENLDRVSVMCGSHNEQSNLLLTQLMHERSIAAEDKRIWFAQLYGMSDNISFNLAKAGYNVAKYVPYGPVKAVMPYLLRRAAENTSVAGQSSRELTLIRKELKRRKLA
ncbi:proline dehydrogenase family protein [Chryseosolibacter indicus]|uniref:Proline dehydrogenase family protein n=1 Tax=Chryseosolibacter indicus TaxID=2782351 RepID=A0ABS5VL06_9BACT|nr:proline dehydrogenase family protein [Chryseosolibacter indicus]MBT1702129.1 proline dehydrogenase family protein [Chryseosolibacter indicus]